MAHSIFKTVTREQALEIQKRHFDYCRKLKEKRDNINFVRDFLMTNYNLKSITDFICRLSEFDMTKELLRFINDLQSRISETEGRKVVLVYFALKDFIRCKRLEILYKIRDNGMSKCKEEYLHWKILDTIKNTKWKYMNKSFSYDNPIIDKFAEKEYKNIKEASTESSIDIEYIKNNFGYAKTFAYISDFRQFQNYLLIRVTCPSNRSIQFVNFKYPDNEFIFDNISLLSDSTNESEFKLKKYIDKDGNLYNKYTLRTVPFEEQFRMYSPVVIDGKEYCDVTEASQDLCISDRAIIENFNKVYINPHGYSYDIRSLEDESFVTEDTKFPFESDKKFASEMYNKIKEIRDNNSMKHVFFP